MLVLLGPGGWLIEAEMSCLFIAGFVGNVTSNAHVNNVIGHPLRGPLRLNIVNVGTLQGVLILE